MIKFQSYKSSKEDFIIFFYDFTYSLACFMYTEWSSVRKTELSTTILSSSRLPSTTTSRRRRKPWARSEVRRCPSKCTSNRDEWRQKMKNTTGTNSNEKVKRFIIKYIFFYFYFCFCLFIVFILTQSIFCF